METPDEDSEVAVHLQHHIQQELCTTRAPYRQGRKLTAVKVYSVSNESQHLLVYRVPSIKLQNELNALCSKFGTVSRLDKLELVDPGEEFTDVYHVCYSRIRDARRAKRGLDGRSFYGSPLHVCYAPELESVEETRLKLINRRNEIAYHTGRKMKVPNLSTQRPGLVHGTHRPNKLQQPWPSLGPGMNQGSGFSRPSTAFSYSQPSTPSYTISQSTSSIAKSSEVKNPIAMCKHSPTLPLVTENGAGCTGDMPDLPGLHDVCHSYSSQEVLRLPGVEVKLARDNKFVPSSVAKRAATAPPNKIVFHKKPKLSDSG